MKYWNNCPLLTIRVPIGLRSIGLRLTGLAEGDKDGNWERVTVEDGETKVVSTGDGEGTDVDCDVVWVVMVMDGTGVDVGSDGG